MKREEPEVREAKSLKKEYDIILKYANRLDASKLEKDYFKRMADNTARKINWRLLEKRKKEIVEES